MWVDGKFLPKGTIAVLNIWGLNHDEKFYPNSQEFDPDRYLGKTLPASEYVGVADYNTRDHYAYGAGRRLCTGIHIAERDLFIAMSMLLWAFNFEQQTDPVSGKALVPETDPDTGYIEGLVTCPKKFPCKVTVRSAQRKETIMREFAQAEAGILSNYDDCVDVGMASHI